MRDLQRNIERFFYRNRDKGVPNLMLFIGIANVLVYLVDAFDPSHAVYRVLCFHAGSILSGQVWRLFTYIFLSGYGNPLILVLMLFLYYRVGAIIEARCGTFKFNCYYLCGIVIIDILALFTHWTPSVDTFHYSLLLVYAALCPEDQLLLFFIIPVRMKYLALVYLAIIVLEALRLDFFPICAILNFLIFFGPEAKELVLSFGRFQHVRTREEKPRRPSRAAPSPHWADNYRSKDGKKPYRHKCTVCGRTDTEYPDLEFRYCSRCNGYYCYCLDHINNHVHIQ